MLCVKIGVLNNKATNAQQNISCCKLCENLYIVVRSIIILLVWTFKEFLLLEIHQQRLATTDHRYWWAVIRPWAELALCSLELCNHMVLWQWKYFDNSNGSVIMNMTHLAALKLGKLNVNLLLNSCIILDILKRGCCTTHLHLLCSVKNNFLKNKINDKTSKIYYCIFYSLDTIRENEKE